MISDCIMSLRKCEKLMAPNTAKRVGAASAAGCESAVKLLSINQTSLLATSRPVLRECDGESLRSRLSSQPHVSLGRAGIHRRARPDRLFGRDIAGFVRPPVAARYNAAVARPDSSARICGPHHVSHVGGPRSLADIHPDVRDLGGQERASRQTAGPDPGYSTIGADFGFHFNYSRI